ncbi:hypothetical protein BJ878DRAFT_513608 [Calycina marina]|uniref:Beta-ketoacyl synthase-like N-terminal domain-containing protein n=1 Tax=Calycina marina TaxID=1763456 RepID=A0A9P7YZX8_9HELO|nr:hypothetical protein BJ878DRAFT_513608 [Calycina marina]
MLNLAANPEVLLKYKGTGPLNSLLSSRASWFYGLEYNVRHCLFQQYGGSASSLPIFANGRKQSLSFLGKSGRSHSFDHHAEDCVRGEGAGSVIVKRLSDAVRDGNTIRAVIPGTGVNQE